MKFKNILIFTLALLMMVSPVLANYEAGQSIISLGADLNQEQKDRILSELGSDGAEIIEVTNAEEHKYLGGIIKSEKIGNQALSSAKLTLLEKNSGLNIYLDDNVTYVSENVYRNALVTAGITDADVKVTGPFKVTGTAALTGIMKSYEVLTGEELSDDLKRVANEELVVTSELIESFDENQVTALINGIKHAFSENMPANEEEARIIIVNLSNEYNVNLTDSQVDKLLSLFMKMKNINIDWDKIEENTLKYKDKAAEFLQSEKGQGFIATIKSTFNRIVDWFVNLIS